MKLNYILLAIAICLPGILSGQKKLTILHTNDTHSRIEPLPEADKDYPGWAGVVNRKIVIDSVRNADKNVLLLDIGDFVQGTPYFNLFKGQAEIDAINLLKYDAVTIGNHEFDYGLEIMKEMFEKLNSPVVNCNYDFSATILKDLVKPYVILQRDGLKIGVTGVGVSPEGLIQQDKYEGMVFKPVIESANQYADILKEKYKCDVVICLSHIGYGGKDYQGTGVLDLQLAEQSRNIDIILGGHSHTYMEVPDIITNLAGKEVLIYQMGKNGSYIGKIEIDFKKN